MSKGATVSPDEFRKSLEQSVLRQLTERLERLESEIKLLRRENEVLILSSNPYAEGARVPAAKVLEAIIDGMDLDLVASPPKGAAVSLRNGSKARRAWWRIR